MTNVRGLAQDIVLRARRMAMNSDAEEYVVKALLEERRKILREILAMLDQRIRECEEGEVRSG